MGSLVEYERVHFKDTIEEVTILHHHMDSAFTIVVVGLSLTAMVDPELLRLIVIVFGAQESSMPSAPLSYVQMIAYPRTICTLCKLSLLHDSSSVGEKQIM